MNKIKKWIFNKLFLTDEVKNRSLTCKSNKNYQSVENCLDSIIDIAMDYDGYRTPEGLMDLIDEICGIVTRGIEILREPEVFFIENYRCFRIVKVAGVMYANYNTDGVLEIRNPNADGVRLRSNNPEEYYVELDMMLDKFSDWWDTYIINEAEGKENENN